MDMASSLIERWTRAVKAYLGPDGLPFQLPSEIILIVLCAVRDSDCLEREARQSNLELSPGMLTLDILRENAVPAQHMLARCALVCRSWNIVATTLLYERPVISSARSLCRLDESLATSKRSFLPVVRSLILLDYSRLTPWQQYRRVAKISNERDRARGSLHALLARCPNIQSYHVSHLDLMDPVIFSMLRPRIFHPADLSTLTRLRTLTFDGFELYYPYLDAPIGRGPFALPLVEELCL